MAWYRRIGDMEALRMAKTGDHKAAEWGSLILWIVESILQIKRCLGPQLVALERQEEYARNHMENRGYKDPEE